MDETLIEMIGEKLEHDGFSDTEIDDHFLEHYGVKGMKWGVRRQKRLDRANRVASGTASKAEKAKFVMTDTSSKSISRNQGVAGAAKVRAQELQARKDRIEKGKGTVGDFIALSLGGDRLNISGRAPNDNPQMSKTTQRNLKVAAATGAAAVGGILAYNKGVKMAKIASISKDTGIPFKVTRQFYNAVAKDVADVARNMGN